MNERHDDLQEIIDAALREMAAEEGDGFDPQTCNLAEFCRRTGLTRSRARTVRAHGFRALPHGNSGRRAAPGVLAGHTGLVDDLLRKGVTNSQVIFERLLGQGYAYREVIDQMNQTAEGISSVAPVLELAAERGVEMPNVSQVAEVLAGTLDPRDIAPHLTTDTDVPQGE